MHCFRFQPGDGQLYRIVMGQVTDHQSAMPFIFLAIGEGYSEALTGYLFDTPAVSFETFARHLTHPNPATVATAYRVFCALVGRDDPDLDLAWQGDWRAQLPTGGFRSPSRN